MFRTLKGRVVAVSVAVTALSLIAVAGVTLFMTQRSAEANLETSLKQLSQANATQISDWALSEQHVVNSLIPAVNNGGSGTELVAVATAVDFDDAYIG